MTPLRLAVVGCTGRMGQTLVQLATEDPAFDLVAAATTGDDPRLGQDAGSLIGGDAIGVLVTNTIDAPCDVVIEFTLPPGCASWTQWCLKNKTPLVSGTTGLTDSQQAALREAAEQIPIVWAPNMSVGVNLMLAMVAELAGRLDEEWDVEICETHHRRKVDAPSGTALSLARAIAEASGRDLDAEAVYGRHGQAGPRPKHQIGIHAVRLGDQVGQHEIHFGGPGETLVLRHTVHSRDTFARGALRAAKWIAGQQPGFYTMGQVVAPARSTPSMGG